MGAQGFLNNYQDELGSKARPAGYHGERGAKRAPPSDRTRAGERPPPPHENRLPEDRRLERRNPSHALGGKGSNTALFDSQGRYVIGEDMSSSGAPDVSVDIVSEGKRIGELRSWPNAEGFTLLATEFSKQQLVTSLLIASCCLFVAGVVSWFLSKRLLKPLNLISNAVSTLSNGKFDVTFAYKRSDEIGQLMRDIEYLSKTLEYPQEGQQKLAFLEGAESIKAYEYAVLMTNMDDEVISIVQHYRDRADCENNFDELTNPRGWVGFTMQKIKNCRLISRMTALVYNWWTLFVRLALPDGHREAITSRPLLLSSVSRMTKSGRQKTIRITSQHDDHSLQKVVWKRVDDFFNSLKVIAPQLNRVECWSLILRKAMEAFFPEKRENNEKWLSTESTAIRA